MRNIKRLLLSTPIAFIAVALFLLLNSPVSKASDIYVAQSPTGTQNGSSCSSTRSVSSLSGSDWSPGNTIHLCGTISSPISVGGSGSASAPLSLVFESGAKISVGTCGSSGCINVASRSYVIIDGGSNGIIEATKSGTGQGSGDSVAIYGRSGISNVEIKNLTINNMYVHTSPSDDNGNNYFGVWMDGSNNKIHDNTIDNAYAGIKVEVTSTNNQYYKNTIHNVNWGIFESGSGTNSISNEKIYSNEIYDFAGWDTYDDANHHDGIFLSGNSQTTDVTHVDVYNNYLHGTTSSASTCAGAPGNGSCMTAYIYINTDSYVRVFNNLIVMNAGDPGPNNGEILMFVNANDSLYNNTLIGGGNSANNSSCLVLNSGTNFTVKNNIFSNCPNLIWNNGSTISALDYNVYQNGSLTWRSGNNYYNSLSAWQSASGGDKNAQATTGSLNLSSSYVPQSGSIVVDKGTNLTALSITPLDADRVGTVRSSTGAWSIGAYELANGSTPPAPPTGLVAVAQ